MKLRNKSLLIQVELCRQRRLLRLAQEFRKTEDPEEVQRLGNVLGKMVFGASGPKGARPVETFGTGRRRPPQKAAAT